MSIQCRLLAPTADKSSRVIVNGEEFDYAFVVDGLERSEAPSFTFVFFDLEKENGDDRRCIFVNVHRDPEQYRVKKMYYKDKTELAFLDIPKNHPFFRHIVIKKETQ